ncbi:MAG: hypothetical protein J0I12_34860 [Candidatus Eremiobacteraeota bacterium]|nr:hypothetical protein [Candidatus Eremiobacteraeota bacterium]
MTWDTQDRVDELDAYLLNQTGEAHLDSSGTFTVDRQKALEKLAHFQLPSEHHWALKFVQAAVASGSKSLKITLKGHCSEFLMESSWTIEQVEEAFFNPDPSRDRDLNHLKAGLWSVGYAGMRPFQFIPGGSSQSLIWNGESFAVVACVEHPQTRLIVSQRTRQQRSLFLLNELEALRNNQALTTLLAENAFFSPIPLTVDHSRLDGIHRGVSTQGIYPIAMLWASGDFPPLQLPPGTNPAFHRGDPNLPTQGCCALVAGQLSGLDGGLCSICWIHDGVLVERQTLAFSGRVTATLFASAEGLATDLSGFALRNDSSKEGRGAAVFASLEARVGELVVDYPKEENLGFPLVTRFGEMVMGSGVLLAGAGFLTGNPLAVLLGGAASTAGFKMTNLRTPAFESVAEAMTRGLQELQAGWSHQLSNVEITRPRREAVALAPASKQKNTQGREPRWKRRS